MVPADVEICRNVFSLGNRQSFFKEDERLSSTVAQIPTRAVFFQLKAYYNFSNTVFPIYL